VDAEIAQFEVPTFDLEDGFTYSGFMLKPNKYRIKD